MRLVLHKPIDTEYIVVVVTSDSASDDPIAAWCAENRIECFRGSENDVLGRVYKAAVHYGADLIIRLTGDCPFLDPRVSAAVGAWYEVLNGQRGATVLEQ